MPVLTDWNISLSVEDVFRIQHTDAEVIRKRRPGIVEMTERGVRQTLDLIRPVVVYETIKVDWIQPDGIRLTGGFQLTGDFLARQLAGAEEVVAAVCTIGGDVEKIASEKMAANKHVEGYAIDSAGIVAVGKIADKFFSGLETEAKLKGKQSSHRFSPGLPGWSVVQGQPEIFAILEKINSSVDLCPSMQMVPIKSLSFIVGVGEKLVRKGNECAYCGLRDYCTYRAEHDSALTGKACLHNS